MRRECRTLGFGGLLLAAAACGGSCPRPTIAAVPPSKLPQRAFKLPLGEDGRKQAIAYLGGGADLDSEQFCAVEAMFDSGTYVDKMLRCSGAVELEVYDPRERRPIRGVALGGYVFAVYSKGIPPRRDSGKQVLIFPDQLPPSAD